MLSYSILGSDHSARLRCLFGFRNQFGIQQYTPAMFLASILGMKLPLNDQCALDVVRKGRNPSKHPQTIKPGQGQSHEPEPTSLEEGKQKAPMKVALHFSLNLESLDYIDGYEIGDSRAAHDDLSR